MGLRVFWTRFAQNRLEDIFGYYKRKAGKSVARKRISGIVDRTIDLGKTPHRGQKEELLVFFQKDLRYLVFKKYKIIYFINSVSKKIPQNQKCCFSRSFNLFLID